MAGNINVLGRFIASHEGDYSPTRDYIPLEICYLDGATYMCKAPTTGNPPPDPLYWILMSTSASTIDRDAAAASALAAAGSATDAAAQVTLAAAQVTLAEGQAGIATTKAGEASTSATAAANSAGQAEAHMGDAELAAGEAEQSATSAASSATAAAQSAASVDGPGLYAAIAAAELEIDTHTHGNISRDGKVGLFADRALITGPDGLVIAKTIDEALGIWRIARATKPNILHNWDMRNPINQRGVSGLISALGYFIDCWILVSGEVTLNNGYLTLGTGAAIEQRMEGNALAGQEVTMSIMDTTGAIISATGTFPIGVGSVDVPLGANATLTLGNTLPHLYIRVLYSGGGIT